MSTAITSKIRGLEILRAEIAHLKNTISLRNLCTKGG